MQTSPTSTHPPLQLRLTSPEEPGYFLERIPVQNMKQVWGILEVCLPVCNVGVLPSYSFVVDRSRAMLVE